MNNFGALLTPKEKFKEFLKDKASNKKPEVKSKSEKKLPYLLTNRKTEK